MSTTRNIPNYAASYLKRFANQAIPESQLEVRYRFIEAVERLFSEHSNVADLWEHLGYNLDSYTDISRRRPGHLLFWSDGSSEGLGIVLNDTDKLLQLDPAASGTLPILDVADNTFLGGLDVGVLAGEAAENDAFPIIPYKTGKTHGRKRISADPNTGRLSGLLIFNGLGTMSNTDLDLYVKNFAMNVDAFWSQQTVPSTGAPVTVFSSNNSLNPFVDDPNNGNPLPLNSGNFQQFIIDQEANGGLNECIFAVQDQNLNLRLQPQDLATLRNKFPTTIIEVGNTSPKEYAPFEVSYVDIKEGYGFMKETNNAAEAAHEFGHLCGLQDRYLECIEYPKPDDSNYNVRNIASLLSNFSLDTNGQTFENHLAQVGIPSTVNAVFVPRRANVPIVTWPRQMELEPDYDYQTNLYSRPQPGAMSSITDYQLQTVFSNRIDNQHVRIDFWIDDVEFQNIDGIHIDYRGVDVYNVDLRDDPVELECYNAWLNGMIINQIPGQLNITFITQKQWLKIYKGGGGKYRYMNKEYSYQSNTLVRIRFPQRSSSGRSLYCDFKQWKLERADLQTNRKDPFASQPYLPLWAARILIHNNWHSE
jgi:hypothetical protein